MGLFSFGKRHKPRQFGFIPRYYDADKEDLQARLAKYDDAIDNVELSKTRIRSGFKSNSRSGAAYSKAAKQSNFRLLMIIFVLCFAVYMILKSDSVLKLIQSISGG